MRASIMSLLWPWSFRHYWNFWHLSIDTSLDIYPRDFDLISSITNCSETEDAVPLTQDDDEEVPPAQEQCRTSAVDMIASDDEVDEKDEDWDNILGSQVSF